MKSDRSAAFLLITMAFAGILFANSPFGSSLNEVKQLEISFGLLSIDLEHLVSELLLAIFFLVAGLELKHEFRLGSLSNLRVALVPIVAAISGVVMPAMIYLAHNPSAPSANGWSIPTATDIAFALGMLAIIGRGLPPAARVFLLALAIFDDVIAILIIAVKFTSDLEVAWLLLCVASALSLRITYPRLGVRFRPYLLAASFAVSWFAMYNSGVHATIAGVITGLAVPSATTHHLVKTIQPYSNGVVLPVFAFFAVSIQLPDSFTTSSSIFLGIAIALPVGKLLGIALVGYLMNRLVPVESRLKLSGLDFAIVAALAGIGFTVSLLLAKLSFEGAADLQSEAVFGVLVGSIASIVLAIALAQIRRKFSRDRVGLAL